MGSPFHIPWIWTRTWDDYALPRPLSQELGLGKQRCYQLSGCQACWKKSGHTRLQRCKSHDRNHSHDIEEGLEAVSPLLPSHESVADEEVLSPPGMVPDGLMLVEERQWRRYRFPVLASDDAPVT